MKYSGKPGFYHNASTGVPDDLSSAPFDRYNSVRQLNPEMQLPARERQLLGEELTLGHFALVSYIPDPLARFLDDLRVELVPYCRPHAHVTILPPRPLHDPLKDIVQGIAEDIRGAAPFPIELGEIEIFEASHVIYLGLARGTNELLQLYRALNHGSLKYTENFPYHPHIEGERRNELGIVLIDRIHVAVHHVDKTCPIAFPDRGWIPLALRRNDPVRRHTGQKHDRTDCVEGGSHVLFSSRKIICRTILRAGPDGRGAPGRNSTGRRAQ
jgi:hypothetical protein